MLDNLIFSLNATLPIFFLMLLGMWLKKINIFNDNFVSVTNKFVFKVTLPILLFQDLSDVDFVSVWDTKFVLFCFIATLISILLVTLISYFWKDRTIQGEFVQASYRSSAAILGIAFIQNIYGTSGMAPLMIAASVPLYNVIAVICLSVLKPEREKIDRTLILNTLKGILTNPIILGILCGIVYSLLKLPKPVIMDKSLQNIAVLATPLGLMSMGAAFHFSDARSTLKPAVVATVIKLVALCSIFLPIAIHMGFRDEKIIAILVMLGSSTTVSCYIMAKNMGHKGVLTSNVVMLTTLFSAFTLTGWLYLLKTLELIA